MDNKQVRRLLEKYRKGTLSDHERALLEGWYATQISNNGSLLSEEELQRNLKLVGLKVFSQTGSLRKRMKYTWVAAAAVLIISITVGYLIAERAFVNEPKVVVQQDVAPGGNKATLKLTDGRVISLNTDQNRIIVGNGIVYGDRTEVFSNSNEIRKHILELSTPKGGTYEVMLSDGTRVWLNAASTLRYPSYFSDDERVVELEGEGYFEVATSAGGEQQFPRTGKRVPFVVKSKGQDIIVLGTAFNVSCYAEEPETKTTLINGRVKVHARNFQKELTLEPGHETILSADGVKVRKADIASAIAWKSGKFRFDETELHGVIQQISRWYDLEVEYRGTITEKYFFGVINRDQKLSRVLEVLKEGGVNFTIEKVNGKNRLIVLP